MADYNSKKKKYNKLIEEQEQNNKMNINRDDTANAKTHSKH